MISNEDKLREAKSVGRWQYLAVKKLSALLRRITSWSFLLSELLSFFYSRKQTKILH